MKDATFNREIRITDKRVRDSIERNRKWLKRLRIKKQFEVIDDEPLQKSKDSFKHRVLKWLFLIVVIILLLAKLVIEPSGFIVIGIIGIILFISRNIDTTGLNGRYLEVGTVYAQFKQDRIEFDFAKRTIHFDEIDYIEFTSIFDYHGYVQLRFNVHYKDKDKETDTLYYWNELDIRFDEFVLLFKKGGVQFNPTTDKYIEKFMVKRGMADQYFNAFDIPKDEQQRINQLTNERETHWFRSY